MSNDFNNYVHKRLNKMSGILSKKFNLGEWKPDCLKLWIEFMPVMLNKEGIAFVPIGTKDCPEGVSLLGDDYVVFIEEDGEIKLYSHALELKEYIKEFYNELIKEVDKDFYKTMGIMIELEAFKRWRKSKD